MVLQLLQVGLGENCFSEILGVLLLVEELDVWAVSILLKVDFDWGHHLSVEKLLFIDGGKPGVRQNFIDVAVGAQALLLILAEEFLGDVHKLIGVLNSVLPLVGVHDLRLSNFEEQQLSLFVVEGCHSNKHLVYQDSKSPPVNREIVSLVHDHLR